MIVIVAIGASIAVTLLTAKSTRQPPANETASAETVVAQETAGSNFDAGKVDSTQSAANISVAGTNFIFTVVQLTNRLLCITRSAVKK